MTNTPSIHRHRKTHEMKVTAIYDPDGPTFSELLHAPDMRGWFHGLLVTGELLKPESRQKYFPEKYKEVSL